MLLRDIGSQAAIAINQEWGGFAGDFVAGVPLPPNVQLWAKPLPRNEAAFALFRNDGSGFQYDIIFSFNLTNVPIHYLGLRQAGLGPHNPTVECLVYDVWEDSSSRKKLTEPLEVRLRNRHVGLFRISECHSVNHTHV